MSTPKQLTDREQYIICKRLATCSTPFQRAAETQFLQEMFADPTHSHNYAMRIAISTKDIELMKYLIFRGVNPRDPEILEAARDEGDKVILAFLKNA